MVVAPFAEVVFAHIECMLLCLAEVSKEILEAAVRMGWPEVVMHQVVE